MAEYNSETKTIPYNEDEVFSAFSDLRRIEKIKDNLPEHDQIKNITYDKDSCTVNVSPIGKVRFVVTERIPNSTVKFEAEQLPFKLELSIQLKQEAEDETHLNVKVDADLNPFLKPLVSKPLQEALETMASALAIIPYDKVNNISHE